MIGDYMQKAGVRLIAEHFGIGQWAVRKWAQQGHVPNSRLEVFCSLTGAKPREVCDPSLDFLFRSDATKGS